MRRDRVLLNSVRSRCCFGGVLGGSREGSWTIKRCFVRPLGARESCLEGFEHAHNADFMGRLGAHGVPRGVALGGPEIICVPLLVGSRGLVDTENKCFGVLVVLSMC